MIDGLKFTFPVNELAAALVEQLLPHFKGQPQQEPTTPPAEKYRTRKETATRLNVSLPTLNEYTKKGLIIGHRFGVRVMYKESQIEAALTKMNYGRAGNV